MAITKNSQIDLNGNEMILDADADTKIDAATDDEIHFTVAGSETVYMGVTSYNASDRIVLTNTGGNASATIVGSTSGESSIFMADGTSGDASYRGYVQYQHTNDNMNFGTAGAEKMRILSDGKVGISTTTPLYELDVNGEAYIRTRLFAGDGTASSPSIRFYNASAGLYYPGSDALGFVAGGTEYARLNSNGKLSVTEINHISSGSLEIGNGDEKQIFDATEQSIEFQTADTERARFDASGNFLINRTAAGFNNDGTVIGNSGGSYMYIERTTTGNAVIYVHRRSSDGSLIAFYQGNSLEGSISVSGANVTYGGFTGTHDSSGTGISSSTQVGTILSTIDEEHKPDHAKVKVSDTEGDSRVYGVLQEYKTEETSDTGITSPEHAVVASVGIGSVRVTGACEGGDLLESNGDGTAKVQDDDIIRSKTIGKVTIGNSDTDVKLVSCVLYCG